MKKGILVLWIFSFMQFGCYEDILSPSELGEYTPKLVVNGIIRSGEAFEFQLSNSTAATDTQFPNLVKDAIVELGWNSNVSTMVYDPFNNTYTSSVVAEPGDRISLTIRATGYPVASALTYIPSELQTVSELIPEGGRDTSGILSDLLKVSFQDDGSQKNFYKINFFYYDNTLGQFIPMVFTANDPSLADYNSYKLNDGSILFDDQLFNGKLKVLSTVAIYGLVLGNPNEKYLIELESVSEAYFKYMSSLQRARDAKESTFTSAFNNAVVIYSNINNGLGILGAGNAVKDTLY